MPLGALGVLGLRGASILGASLGKGQNVKQAVASASIFGLGYGGLTNFSYNVSNEFVTKHFRSPKYSYRNTPTYNLTMPYGRYPRRRYGYSRYTRRYPRRYRRSYNRGYSYYGRRYY